MQKYRFFVRGIFSGGHPAGVFKITPLDDVESAAVATFSVSASNWSNLLAPGTTSGAGNRMMLSDIRIELVY